MIILFTHFLIIFSTIIPFFSAIDYQFIKITTYVRYKDHEYCNEDDIIQVEYYVPEKCVTDDIGEDVDSIAYSVVNETNEILKYDCDKDHPFDFTFAHPIKSVEIGACNQLGNANYDVKYTLEEEIAEENYLPYKCTFYGSFECKNVVGYKYYLISLFSGDLCDVEDDKIHCGMNVNCTMIIPDDKYFSFNSSFSCSYYDDEFDDFEFGFDFVIPITSFIKTAAIVAGTVICAICASFAIAVLILILVVGFVCGVEKCTGGNDGEEKYKTLEDEEDLPVGEGEELEEKDDQ